MKTQTEIQVPFDGAEEAPGGGIFGGPILLFAGMIILMWALLIRPQQRQQKKHREMLTKIQKGDQVVTTGGIHGRVLGISDEVLTVEIANGVRVKLSRSAVQSRAGSEAEKK